MVVREQPKGKNMEPTTTMHIPDEHFRCDEDGNYPVEYPENTIVRSRDGSIWYRDEEDDWSHLGRGSAELRGPAELLNFPEGQGQDDLRSAKA